MSKRRPPSRLADNWPLLTGIGLLVLLAWGGWHLYAGLGAMSPPEPPAVQQISIVQPPPPPPPPPETIKPPPEKVEQIAEPEPEPTPEPVAEEPAPSDDLGLDADGVAGSDGFGLKAKRGGRELTRGGGGGNAAIWYGQKLGSELGEALRSLLSDRINARGFTATAALWVAADGRVSRAELASSSGDPEVDSALRAALAALDLRLPQAPPSNMPQPVKIRVRARS